MVGLLQMVVMAGLVFVFAVCVALAIPASQRAWQLRHPASPTPAVQPATVEAAQQEAVRRYPALGVAGSRFNVEFLARHQRYQKERPEFLRDPAWPLRLAEEIARTVPAQ